MMQRTKVLLFVCLLALVSDTALLRAQSTSNNYVLVFSDEFNQPNGSQPDAAKWSRAKRYHAIWNRWISNSEDVVYIKNGQLVCRAIPNRSLPNDTAKMLTGAIESIGKFSFQYGKVEVRMRTNNYRGNFPAAWMKPEKIDPERYGEIDIMETFGNQGLVHQTIHSQQTMDKNKPASAHTRASFTKWHIYGLEWTPDRLILTIDGKVTQVYEKAADRQNLSAGQWTFDRPFYLILNQSVGDGRNEFMIPNTRQTYETHFDWIRVYQKKD